MVVICIEEFLCDFMYSLFDIMMLEFEPQLGDELFT
jgi:hypothetical protein